MKGNKRPDLAACLTGIQSPKVNERRRAAAALAEFPCSEAAQALIHGLGDSNGSVRAKAVESLGRFADPGHIQHFVAALSDELYPVRVLAVGAIGGIGTDAAIPALVAALGDAELPVVQEAAKRLARLGVRCRDAVLTAAERIPSYWGRYYALDLLVAFEDRRAVPVAVRLIQDPHPWVRERALKAAGSLGDASVLPELLLALESNDPLLSKAAAEGLSVLAHADATDALLRVASRCSEGVLAESALAEVAYALGTCGDERVLPVLLNLLAHTSVAVQGKAADGLGRLGNSRACPALLERLRHDDGRAATIVNIAGALRRLQCVGVVDDLLTILKTPGAPARAWAACALGGARDERTKQALLDALRCADDDGSVAQFAAEALLVRGDDSVTPEVANFLGTARFGQTVALTLYEWMIRWGLGEAVLVAVIGDLDGEFRSHLEVFLGCGNPRLEAAARRVCDKYRIHPRPRTSLQWGSCNA